MNSNKDNTEKKNDATYWHPAFCAALQLEFRENKGELEFHMERPLSQKPLAMDLLVLVRSPGAVMHNPLGAIFKMYNVIEYKSPGDQLNIDDFSKGIAYACLYKALSPKVNRVPFEELTLSFVLQRVPQKMFQQLEAYGFRVENPTPGIYYIHIGRGKTPHIQVIVTGRLEEHEHLWLTSLTRDLTEERAVRLAEAMEQLEAKDDREWADSVLHVAITENKRVFKKIMEVPDMCEALRELFQPEIDQLDAKYQAQLAEKDAEIDRSNEIIRQLEARLAAAGIGVDG